MQRIHAIAGSAFITLAVACGVAEEAPEADASAVDADPAAGALVARSAAQAANRAPSVERVRITPLHPQPGSVAVAFAQARDADGDEVSLGYTWTLGRERLPGGEAQIQIPERAEPGQVLQVSVIASDGTHVSPATTASVELDNRAPRVNSVAFDLEEGAVPVPGDELRLAIDASDPDGQALERSVRWLVNGREIENTSEVLRTDGLQRGDVVQAELTVRDGDDRSAPGRTPKLKMGNSDPKITSSPGGLDAGGAFRYALQATDRDGDQSFRYRLVEGPKGMRLDPVLGELSWQPAVEDAGVHWIEVAVADKHGGEARQRFDLTIRVGGEDPPQSPVAAPRP